MLYIEETAGGSFLAGFLILLAALWCVWGAHWLRRIELRAIAEPVVHALGLRWAPEGFGPRVVAVGEVDGVAVTVWWRGAAVWARRSGGRPVRLANDDLVGAVQSLARGGA